MSGNTTVNAPSVTPAPTLAAKARSAVIWNAGFNLFRDLLQFGVMLVLVRLLYPEAYGQFGLVTSIIGFISIFSFNNFVAHTVQVRSDHDTHYQAHFTAGAVLQISMFVLTNIVGFALRWLPSYAVIGPFLHIMSVTFLLEWPCELRRKMIERALDWRRLRLLHAVGLIGNAVLAIVMAMLGAGVYALLIPGMIVTLPFTYDLFVRSAWRPDWSFSWARYRDAWKFGVTRIGSGLTLSGRQLLESSTLSAIVGFASLGVLNRSIGLAQIFCLKFSSQLMYAIYPMLTRMEPGSANSARIAGLVLRTVTWVVIPIAVCFGIVAEPIVFALYGSKWSAVTPLLPYAMAWGVAAAVLHAAYTLLLARQGARKCLLADITALATTGIAVWFAARLGLKAYLAVSVASQSAIAMVLLFTLVRAGVVTGSGVVQAFAGPVVAAGVSAGLATAFFGYGGFALHTILSAVGWSAFFWIAFVAVLRLLFTAPLAELVDYLPGRTALRCILFLRRVAT